VIRQQSRLYQLLRWWYCFPRWTKCTYNWPRA